VMPENKMPTIEFLTEYTTIEFDHARVIRYCPGFRTF